VNKDVYIEPVVQLPVDHVTQIYDQHTAHSSSVPG